MRIIVSTPWFGVSTPRIGVSTPRVGVSTSRVGVSTPRVGASTPRVGGYTPRTGIAVKAGSFSAVIYNQYSENWSWHHSLFSQLQH